MSLPRQDSDFWTALMRTNLHGGLVAWSYRGVGYRAPIILHRRIDKSGDTRYDILLGGVQHFVRETWRWLTRDIRVFSWWQLQSTPGEFDNDRITLLWRGSPRGEAQASQIQVELFPPESVYLQDKPLPLPSLTLMATVDVGYAGVVSNLRELRVLPVFLNPDTGESTAPTWTSELQAS